MTRKQPPRSFPVEIDFNGQPFTGTYTVESDVIVVSTVLHGRKATQLGSLPAESLAKTLLREIAAEAEQEREASRKRQK